MATARFSVSVSKATKKKEVLIVYEKFKFRPQEQVYQKNDKTQFSPAAGRKAAWEDHG